MMDTLLTTFFSTAPIMVPTWAMGEEKTTLIEELIVELDLMSQSLSNHQCDQQIDYLSTSMTVIQGAQVNELSTSSTFAMKLDDRGAEESQQQQQQQQSQPTTFCPSNSPLQQLFQHQLYHRVHNERMKNTLHTSHCCSYFGRTDKCAEHQFCCHDSEMSTEMFADVVREVPCPCEMSHRADGGICIRHGMRIQYVEQTDNGCMWIIGFDEDDEDEFYEDESDEITDDTFEIEFSSEIYSTGCNSYEITNLSYTRTHSHPVYDFICDSSSEDEEEEETGTQTMLSSSQLESNDCNHKHKKERSFPPHTMFERRTNSKYHNKCSHNNNNYNNNNNETANQLSHGTQVKKKVHFPEDDKLVEVQRLVAWPHAYRESRRSVWYLAAQDRVHFHRKIENKFSKLLNPVLKEKFEQFQLPYCS